MSKNDKAKRVSRRVSFTLEEDAHIQRQAEQARMTVSAYIRQQALNSVVQAINWDALRAHADILSDVALEVYLHLDGLSETDRAMCENVLTVIKGDIKTMLSIEQRLYQFLYPDLEM